MKCPACKTVNLVMSERQGVEIDYCPECRGVWLDRGELDKIIERSASEMAPPSPPPSSNRDSNRSDDQYRQTDDRDNSGYHLKKKKKSFLGELFEFGD